MSRPWIRPLAALAALLAVAACGVSTVAGVGNGGTGGTGVAGGVVTGFGSIVVDGVRWDVRDAPIVTEILPSEAWVPVAPKLGQSVEIGFTEPGIATSVRIEPSVIAEVSGVDAAAAPAVLSIAGQTVRVNGDPQAGPITLFSGYASIAEIKPGDVVEIHGGQVFDNRTGRYAIQATRIEKLDQLPAGYVRVAGIVQSLSSTEFRLGELTVHIAAATRIIPLARNLDNGYRVVAWGRPASLSAGGAPTLVADFVRIKDAPPAAGPAQISGLVSHFNSASSTFEVNGIRVIASGVPGAQSVTDGAYVSVNGTYLANGSLQASQLRIHLVGNAGPQVQIAGSITDFINIERFLVRGVRVNAASANLVGCGDQPLGYGRFVSVAADIVDNVVTATSVVCAADPPPDATLSYLGAVSNLDLLGQMLTLTHTEVGDLDAQWTDTTLFSGVTPDTLDGNWVAIEGYYRAGVFIVTKIELGALAQVQADRSLADKQ